MENEVIGLDVIRPLLHQHVTMLTAAGKPPDEALRMAADVVAMVYDDEILISALRAAAIRKGAVSAIERIIRHEASGAIDLMKAPSEPPPRMAQYDAPAAPEVKNSTGKYIA